MKFAPALGLLVAALLLGVAAPNAAHAQICSPAIPGGFGPLGGWYGYGSSPYSLGQIPTPPYFAIHPPVYYSYPIPRTYGYSPYAYPGTVMTPEIVAPEVIENPHATKKLEPAKIENAKVVQAQVIENPYVRPELRRIPTRLATN